MKVGTTQGYDSRSKSRVLRVNGVNHTYEKRALPKGVNCWLTAVGEEHPLWCYEIQTNFGLSGNTAQSARTRTLFPRSFQQPSISVMTQSPNQEHYSRTVEFIHKAQRAMDGGLMVLEVITGHPRGSEKHHNLKGPHQPIRAYGYVRTIAREHMAGVVAPDLTFDFIVYRWDSPRSWADAPVNIRKLKSWHDIVEGILKNDRNAPFEEAPDDTPSGVPGYSKGEGRPD